MASPLESSRTSLVVAPWSRRPSRHGRPAPQPSHALRWTGWRWLLGLLSVGLLTSTRAQEAAAEGVAGPAELGSRLEWFADGEIVERLAGSASLRLHEPHPVGTVLRFDRPWEGAFSGYVTVLQDGDRMRLYYRGLPVAGRDGSPDEVTCYAESADGLRWEKPDLGLFEVRGTRSNNVVLAGQAPFSHNFAPFLDRRPGVPAEEKYKALAGTSETGLHAFVSGDGLRWRRWREDPLLRDGAFDSQNVGFWSEAEGCYVVYFRTWTQGGFNGYRTISRSTSKDFATWTTPVAMTFGDAPLEHLYTSQTHPYFRAPHLYVATPMRFMPGRRVLTPAQALSLGVAKDYASDTAEAVFMTSRGGNRYRRLFLEGFIRPGPDLGNWASRAGLTALGIVPTGVGEMSLYKQAHYAQPSCELVRFVLRTDGFVSVRAGFGGGEMVTRALRFRGKALWINLSTGAAGGVRVEIQDEGGVPLPGFALADAVEQVGDEIGRRVEWRGGWDLSALAGRVVRLRMVLKDADLYAFQFLP